MAAAACSWDGLLLEGADVCVVEGDNNLTYRGQTMRSLRRKK
jgi:hypothetical protein